MGISLKDRRKGGRRSYADFKPPKRNPGPRNDPFRIVLYILLIAGGIWVYFNQDVVQAEISQQAADAGAAVSAARATATPENTGRGELAAQAEAAYQDGQIDNAIDLYAQAAEASPETLDFYVQQARLLIFRSALEYGEQRVTSLEQAVEVANTAVLVAPERPEGFAIMGKAYDWQGRPDQATSTILRGIEIDENYGLAHAYYSEALVDLDRWDQAQEAIDIALELTPNHVDVRRDYGYLLERLGDYDAAVTQYEAAIEIHPRLAYLRVALARVYRVEGRYNDALDQLFEAQLIASSNPIIPFELGRTYETYIGDPAEALSHYERATNMDPEYPSPWLRIGTLRYFEGSYEDAITAFERALALDVETTDLYYQLGLSYAYEGNCVTAIRYLDEARDRSEGDERILDAIATGYETCSEPTPTSPIPTPES